MGTENERLWAEYCKKEAEYYIKEMAMTGRLVHVLEVKDVMSILLGNTVTLELPLEATGKILGKFSFRMDGYESLPKFLGLLANLKGRE